MFKIMPYCMKCRKITAMDQEYEELIKTKKGGRFYLTGPCVKCGTKQVVFTDEHGYYAEHSEKEREIAKKKRALATRNRKALKIGLKVIDNDARDCVRKCIGKKPIAENTLEYSSENIPSKKRKSIN